MSNQGQELWARAKKLIPGANMLLSKRAELHHPTLWPTYFTRTSGCSVWDLDSRHFYDLSYMGIGTNVLGYSNPSVDLAVHQAVKDGNLSTLNAPEEVYLAERLVALHPWSQMVKYARSGGEANAISIRIARTFTKRQKVAICGYHGWHDWYLAANLTSDSRLEEHLLPGLTPNGVPSDLSGTIFPFSYNNISALESIFDRHELAAVKMEVERSIPPDPSFLASVRKLCDQHNTLLIFDECTSGFRETFGGLHLKYSVLPDLAVFGKTLGNGYAITAVLGTEDVMQSAQDTFISSTFWTERIGSCAALATLDQMQLHQSHIAIPQIGQQVKALWKSLSNRHNIPINISGIDSLPTFSFACDENNVLKTFLTQEMLSKGFLATTAFYASLAHTSEILDLYAYALDDVFSSLAQLGSVELVNNHLVGPPAHSGFSRLN